MAKKKDTKYANKGHLTFEELFFLAKETEKFLERDVEEFSRFGIDSSGIEAFKQQVIAYEKLSYDLEFVAKLKDATVNLKDAFVLLKTELFELHLRSVLHFGKNAQPTKSFQLSSISTLSASDLLHRASLAERLAKENSLYAGVLTLAHLAQIQLLSQNLSNAMASQEVAISNRKLASAERNLLTQEFYETVKKIRHVGKRIWANSNPAKSASYNMPKYKKRKSTDK